MTNSIQIVHAKNQKSGLADPEQWLVDALGGGTTSSSGVAINFYQTVTLPAVWASVNLIAGHFGQLPLNVRRREEGGSLVIDNHPSHRVQEDPGDYQTGMVFRETLMLHALINGNGRAVIIRNGVGQPIELLLMWPESSYTQMVDGEKWHFTTFDPQYVPPDMPGLPRFDPFAPNEAPGVGSWFRFRDQDVLHLPGLSYNGLWGLTVYQVLRDTFGVDKAGQESVGNAFRNNGMPGLVIEVPPHQLRTQKEMSEFKRVWAEAHSGVMNRGKTAFLRDGMKLHQLAGSSVNGEFGTHRLISREDVAMIFGTQHLLGESKAVYKDLSQRMTAYVTNTLSKWLRKYEEECDRKLLSDRERRTGRIYHKFDVSALLRGDPNTMADYTGKLTTQKAVSPNDVRELHGLNRVPGLDDYPSTVEVEEMAPADSVMIPPEDQNDEMENRATRLHFQNMIRVEVKRVREAAEKDDFLKWLEGYYAKENGRYGDLCEQLGIPTHRAEDHVAESCEILQEVAATFEGGNLASAVTIATRNWERRADGFID